jgi:bacterioferritin
MDAPTACGVAHLISGEHMSKSDEKKLTRKDLIDGLNEDLSREYQAIIAYVNYSQVLKGMPSVTPKPVKTSEKAEDMLKFDLANEKETIRQYRRRVKQADALDEFAIAESLRDILVEEQDHLIALATALGIDPPDAGIAD